MAVSAGALGRFGTLRHSQRTTSGLARRRAVYFHYRAPAPGRWQSSQSGVASEACVLLTGSDAGKLSFSPFCNSLSPLSRRMCSLGFTACLSGGAGSNFSVILCSSYHGRASQNARPVCAVPHRNDCLTPGFLRERKPTHVPHSKSPLHRKLCRAHHHLLALLLSSLAVAR